jgi:putative transposase
MLRSAWGGGQTNLRIGTAKAMSGPAPSPSTLTPPQRRVLEQIIRRQTSTQQQVRRAKVVLAAEKVNNAQAARHLGVGVDTARTWRGRWIAARDALLTAEMEGDDSALRAVVLDVLADEPRSGTPATFRPEQICQIVALACEPPGTSERPISQWTARELADEAVKRGIVSGISAQSVARFLASRTSSRIAVGTG